MTGKEEKDGRIKYYCDICGKLIFELIPPKVFSRYGFLQSEMGEYNVLNHLDYVVEHESEYCSDCYKKLEK